MHVMRSLSYVTAVYIRVIYTFSISELHFTYMFSLHVNFGIFKFSVFMVWLLPGLF